MGTKKLPPPATANTWGGVAFLGDLDGDGLHAEVALGANGAVFICWLNPGDGSMSWYNTLRDGQGGVPAGTFGSYSYFGRSIALLGDLDGDGTAAEIAVGAPGISDEQGAVFIIWLRPSDGAATKLIKLARGVSPIPTLETLDRFGFSVGALDSPAGLLVGTYMDDDDGSNAGATYFISLATSGLPMAVHKLANGQSGFPRLLQAGDQFGSSSSCLGDLTHNGQGVHVAIGAQMRDSPDGGTSTGAVFVMRLRTSNGQASDVVEIGEGRGGLPNGTVQINSHFGSSLAFLGELDDTGWPILLVGAYGDDTGATDAGATYMLWLDRSSLTARQHFKLANGLGGMPTGLLGSGAWFGYRMGTMGYPDGSAGCGAVLDRGSGALLRLRDLARQVQLAATSLSPTTGLSMAGGNQVLVGGIDPALTVAAKEGLWLAESSPVNSYVIDGATFNHSEIDRAASLAFDAPKSWHRNRTVNFTVVTPSRQLLIPASLSFAQGPASALSASTWGSFVAAGSTGLQGGRAGSAMARVGDADGDGCFRDVVIGVSGHDDTVARANTGGLLLRGQSCSSATTSLTGTSLLIDGQQLQSAGALPAGAELGASVTWLGSATPRVGLRWTYIAAGTPGSNSSNGSVLLLRVAHDDGAADGDGWSVKLLSQLASESVVSNATAALGTSLAGARFGASLALANAVGKSTATLLIGAPAASGGRGGVLGSDVEASTGRLLSDPAWVGDGSGGLPDGTLKAGDAFGSAVAWTHIDGIGNSDSLQLMVGAPGDDSAGTDSGCVYLLTLHAENREVATWQRLSQSHTPTEGGNRFGASLAWLGDVDGDNAFEEVLIGAPGDSAALVAWVRAENDTAFIANWTALGSGWPGMPASLPDSFGSAVAAMGDWNDDGVASDILIGAPLADAGNGSVAHIQFAAIGEGTLPWGGDVQLTVAAVSPRWALPFDQPTLIRINGTALYEWDPLLQDSRLVHPPEVLISGVEPRGCEVEEVSFDGQTFTCSLSPSLEPNRTLRVKAGQVVSASALEVSYEIQGSVQAVDDGSPLLQSGGGDRTFTGFRLLGTDAFARQQLQAAGVGQLLIGNDYSCPVTSMAYSSDGGWVRCDSMPAGAGGPHPVRLQLPGGIESNSSVTVMYEAAVVSSIEPSKVQLTSVNLLNFTISGRLFGHSLADTPRVVIGGNDCLDIEWHSSTELFCVAVAGNFTNHDVVVYTGTPSLPSTGGNARLDYLESPQVVAALPSEVGTRGGDNITCMGISFADQEHIIDRVLVGGLPCSHWAMVDTNSMTCTTPPGTGRDHYITIATKFGIGTPSVVPALSYAAPVLVSSDPAVAYADEALAYDFDITGTGFGVQTGEASTVDWVKVAGKRCPEVVHVSDAVVRCVGIHPPWDGEQVVQVSVAGQVSEAKALIEFQDPPVVSYITPSTVSTAGDVVTVHGAGFGGSLSEVEAVLVGGQSCSSLHDHSSTAVSCEAPAGTGGNLNVSIVVSRNGASEPKPLFSYKPPSVEALAVLRSNGQLEEYTFAGLMSVDLAVSVQNAGTWLAGATLVLSSGQVWSQACPLLVRAGSAANDTDGVDQLGQLACVGLSLAAFPEAGGTLQAVLAAGGQSSTESSSSLKLVGRPAVSLVTPSTGISTQGSGNTSHAPVQVLGSNFGQGPSDVLGVSVGGVDCPLVEWKQADGETTPQLLVAIPPGVGTQQRLLVTTRGGLSDESGVFIDFEQAAVSGIDPAYALTGLGSASFNITGSNFGNGQSDIDSVEVGGRECESIEWMSSTLVRCLNVSRVGWSSRSVVVTVGGQRGADNELFTGVGAPLLTGILPSSTGWSTLGNGNATSFPIQLVGSNFGRQASDVASVTVGDLRLEHVDFEGDGSIRIAVPPGVGAKLDLTVTTAGGLSSAPLQVSYQPAEVASIEPTYALTGTGTAAFNITGQHFGNRRSDLDRIQVGEQSCSDIEWVSSTRAVCHAVSRASWESRSVTVTVGGQEGLKNSYFEAVGDPVIEVVSPAVAGIGEELLVLGKAFGQQASDIVNVTVLGESCSELTHRGPTALSCKLPPPPADVRQAALTNPRLLRDVPLVVWNAAGKQSAAANVSYSGSGNPLMESPTHLLAWRPVGQPRQFTVRWAFPTDEQMEGVDDVESFTIELSQLAGNATVQEISVRVDSLVDPVVTSEGLRVLRHGDFVFTESTVSIRIRAVNPTGEGPWSAPTPPLPATCADGTFLQTQVDASSWQCGACPVGAFCGGAAAANVTAQPGFWRVPWSRSGLGFVECPRSASCLGYEVPPTATDESAAGSSAGAAAARLLVAARDAEPEVLLPQPPAHRRLAAGDDEKDSPLLNETLAADEVPTAVELRLWGDPLSMEGCAEGYSGTMCTSCTPGYTRWGAFACRKCKSGAMVALAIVGLALLMFVIISYLIVSAVKSGAEKTPVGTAAIKVAFSHIQTVAIAASFNLEWPDSVLALFAGMSTATSVGSEVLSLDCAMPSDGNDEARPGGGDQSRFFDKAALVLALPLLMLAVAALVWLAPASFSRTTPRIARSWSPTSQNAAPTSATSNPLRDRRARIAGLQPLPRGANRRQSVVALVRRKMSISQETLGVQLSTWDKIMTSAVVILFLVHMSMTTTSLQLLTCRDISPVDASAAELSVLEGDLAPAAAAGLASATSGGCDDGQTRRRLVQDLEVCCHDPAAQRKMYGLGIPGLLLYAFGIPIAAALLLWWRQDSLQTHHTKTTLGFLYAGFKEEAYYWESVVMLRKVCVAVIAVSLEPVGVALQTYTALALITGLIALHARVWPYSEHALNQLEFGALLTSFATFECGLFLSDGAASKAVRIIATMVIFFSNLAFLVAAITVILWDKLSICNWQRKRLQATTSAPRRRVLESESGQSP